MKILKAALLMVAGVATTLAQTGNQVQTKNNISMYYFIYPATVAGVTLPGTVPSGAAAAQNGVAIAVQSSDPTVTGFVVTLTYVATDGSTQTTIHKFAAVAGDYATEMFPVGTITGVTSIGVIPTVDQQEVVFPGTPVPSSVSRSAVPVVKKRRN